MSGPLARSLAQSMVRKGWLLGVVCLGAAGCARHKAPRAVMPTIVSLPVEVLDVPEPSLGNIAMVPVPTIKVPTASRVPRDLRRMSKRPVPAMLPAVAAVAPPPPPTPEAASAVIGSLTAGDESASTKQAAGDGITDIEKRLGGLSPDVMKARQAQVAQVRDFVKKARESLNSGDASGAVSLATKARLLLDDLLK